jgi:hypothetical protein
MRKKEEEQNPGMWGFVVTALLALVAGIGIAGAQLAMRPVPDKPLAASDMHNRVVCIRGGLETTKGWDDRAKAVMHDKPGTYTFVEGDINALIQKHLGPVVAIEGIEVVQVDKLPNVRFCENGQVQVAVILTIPELAGAHKFTYQVRGKVVPGGFKPDMGWIGQCPVPFMNMHMLQRVRRQLELDKEVKGLAEVRKRTTFSRNGDELIVDVAAE